MNFVEQLTAIALLIDFLLGVTCGMVSSAAHESRRDERRHTLLGAAPDPISAGALVLHSVYTSTDESMCLLPGGEAGGDKREIDDSRAQEEDEQKPDR
jgi:hypothetical protein